MNRTLVTKATSLILTFGLLLSSSVPPASAAAIAHALAAPEPGALSSVPSRLVPPPALGEITGSYALERWKSSPSPLVLVVMDLHANTGVQDRISGLIGTYQKRLEKTSSFQVLVEGAEGPVDLSLLANQPDRALRTEVSRLFLNKAEFTGPMHYAIATGQANLLSGVDDQKMHAVHLDLYRKSYAVRKGLVASLHALRERVNSLKSERLPSSIRRIENAQTRFEQGKLSLAEYGRFLTRVAPAATAIQMKSRFPLFARLSAELEESSGEHPLSPPEISQAMREADDCSFEVRKALADGPKLKTLLQIDHDLALLEQFIDERADIGAVREAASHLPQALAELNLLAKALPELMNPSQAASFEEAARSARDYYALALLRDRPLAENTIRQLQAANSPNPTAVLVAGGFHADGIAQILREHDIPYALIAPVVDHHTDADQKLYESRMMEKDIPVDEILEDSGVELRPGSTLFKPVQLVAGAVVPVLAALQNSPRRSVWSRTCSAGGRAFKGVIRYFAAPAVSWFVPGDSGDALAELQAAAQSQGDSDSETDTLTVKTDESRHSPDEFPELYEEAVKMDGILEGKLPTLHRELLKRLMTGRTIRFSGQGNTSSPDSLAEMHTTLEQLEKQLHIVFVGDWDETGAEFMLQKLGDNTNINDALRRAGRPQAHFLNAHDAVALERLRLTIPETERSQLQIVTLGSSNDPSVEITLSSLRKALSLKPATPVFTIDKAFRGDAAQGASWEENAGILAAGLLNREAMVAIYEGAREAHRKFEAMQDDDEVTQNPAYQFARAQVRMARGGQNVSVPLVFSTTFGGFSVWLSGLLNKRVGGASLSYFASGARATDHYHSTQQAWAQSGKAPLDKVSTDRAHRGFISLTFLNPALSNLEVYVGELASAHYRGFAYDFMMILARGALRLTLMLSRRPVVEVNFDISTPQGLGQMLHFGQAAAAMTGMLASRSPDNIPVAELDEAVSKGLRKRVTTAPKPGEFERKQNIMTFRDDGSLGGVVGGKLQRQLELVQSRREKIAKSGRPNRKSKKSEYADRTLRTIQRLVAGKAPALASILKAYTGGEQLDHLSKESALRDIPSTDAMAERFKGKKRIYVAAIGGSVSGEILAQTLNMTGGPELIGVHSYDADSMARIYADIEADPEGTGIVVISKSGVTSETDANTWTLIEKLAEANGEMDKLRTMMKSKGKTMAQNERPEKTMQSVLFITDPQLGLLRTYANEHGWLTLDHPVLIGGRFSMFSNVGLFFYFLKGGQRDRMEADIRALPDWDKKLKEAQVAIKGIDGLEEALDPETNVAPEQRVAVLHQIYDILWPMKGVWEGLMDNLNNTVGDRNLEVAMTLSGSFKEFISPNNPFYPQLRAESKSKAGVEFYATALWAWNAIRSAWNRIIRDPRVYATLVGEAHPDGSPGARAEQAAWNAMHDQLDLHGVPYMSVRMGPMNERNLAEFMSMQYLRLAVDTALYEPMKVESEKQPGVEGTKNIFRAEVAQDAHELQQIMAAANPLDYLDHLAEPMAQQMQAGGQFLVPLALDRIRDALRMSKTPGLEAWAYQFVDWANGLITHIHKRGWIPLKKVHPSKIEEMAEIDKDLSSLGFDESVEEDRELKALIEYILQGDAGHPGIATVDTRKAVRDLSGAAVTEALEETLRKLGRHSRGDGRDVLRFAVDGGDNWHSDEVSSNGWLVRATSLDNPLNVLSDASNGTRIGIYKTTGNAQPVELCGSIQVIWGSNVRVIISNGKQTQDYMLLPSGRLIEVGKAGEDNRLRMATKGETLSLGARTTERPQGMNEFEQDVLWPSVDTKIRHSDSGIDYYYMLAKQGLATGWLNPGEALEQAQIMEAAGGSVMIMTDKGMRPVSELKVTEHDINQGDQVYVYAGNRDSVRQIQIFLDFLNVFNENEEGNRLAALDIIDEILGQADQHPSLELRAQAIMLGLRIQQGLAALPKDAALSDEMLTRVDSLRTAAGRLITAFDRADTTEKLKGKYLGLSPADRARQASVYYLLGEPGNDLRSNVAVPAGDPMILVYALERGYQQATTWDMLEAIQGEVRTSTLSEAVAFLQKSYKQNAKTRKTPEAPKLPEITPEETFAEYQEDSVDLRLEPQIRELLGESGVAELRQRSPEVYNRIVDAFTNDQLLDEDPAGSYRAKLLKSLRIFEPEIFYEQDGHTHMHSLQWMLDNIRERKTGSHVNPSGDVSSRLDDIFNRVLIYWTIPLVDIIISEEEPDPVLSAKHDKKKLRLVLFLDPIDGTSQVVDGGAFGKFSSLGFLLPGQTIADFDANTQFLNSMGMQFGMQTMLSFENLAKKTSDPAHPGIAEEVLFQQTADGKFRKINVITASDAPLAALEDKMMEQGEWGKGLTPKTDPMGQRAISFAMGGSFRDSLKDDGHKEVIRWMLENFPHHDGYTGAFAGDVPYILSRVFYNPDRWAAVAHTYGATSKYKTGRYRRPFELFRKVPLFKILGGEAIDGIRPISDLPLTNVRPSELTSPFYGANRWVTKLIMAWENHVLDLKNVGRLAFDLTKHFDEWFDGYEEDSAKLIQAVAKMDDGLTENQVRRRILDQHGNISPLLAMTGEGAFPLLFPERIAQGSKDHKWHTLESFAAAVVATAGLAYATYGLTGSLASVLASGHVVSLLLPLALFVACLTAAGRVWGLTFATANATGFELAHISTWTKPYSYSRVQEGRRSFARAEDVETLPPSYDWQVALRETLFGRGIRQLIGVFCTLPWVAPFYIVLSEITVRLHAAITHREITAARNKQLNVALGYMVDMLPAAIRDRIQSGSDLSGSRALDEAALANLTPAERMALMARIGRVAAEFGAAA